MAASPSAKAPSPTGTPAAIPSLLAVLSVLLVWLRLFRFPTTPILLSGDQVFFWNYGQRLAQGQLPYRDFFQITAPGTDAVFALAFHGLGASVWVADLIVAILGLLWTALLYRLSRKFASPLLSALMAFAFLAIPFLRLSTATHHLFSALLVLAAVDVLATEMRPRYAVAGALLGFAALFTQTRGVFSAIALSIALIALDSAQKKQWPRQLAILWAALLAVTLPVAGFFLVKVGVRELWFWLVEVPSRWPGSGITSLWWSGEAHGAAALAASLLLFAAIPVVYVWTALRLRSQGWREHPAIVLLLMAGIAMSLEILSAPNQLRLLAASAPVYPLTAWLLRRVEDRRLWMYAVAGFLAGFAFHGVWNAQRAPLTELHTAAGTFAARPNDASKLQWLQQRRLPTDKVFEAAYPGIYLPLGVVNPVYADGVLPNRLTPVESIERTLATLRRDRVRFIIWNSALDERPAPETRQAFEDFREYVRKDYVVVFTTAAGEQILELRRPD